MAEFQVVSGLVEKRAELAGEVEHYQRELQRLAAELGHLEATIHLFDPDYDLGSVQPKKRGRRTQWFAPGECQRLVLETLRDAPEPLSGRALAEVLVARKGLAGGPDIVAPVNKTAMAVLRRLLGKGVVRRSALPNGTWVWVLSGG